MNQINQSHIFENYLNEEQYDKAAEYYQSLLEEEPESIKYYWYLGLAYLLQDKEEEAQLTWFMALNQQQTQEEIDSATQELINILDQEAKRQEKLGNQSLTYTIREQIRETYPQNINNLLKLVLLKISLNLFQIEDIKQWNIANLLVENKEDKIDKELLLLVVEILLNLPSDEIIDLAEAVYNYVEEDDSITDLFLSKATKLAQEKGYYGYAAGLCEICLKKKSNNLKILNQVISYYSAASQYNQVRFLAQRFYECSNTIDEKALALRLLISNTITVGDWQEAVKIVAKYKAILQELVKEQPEIKDAYIRNCLSMVTQPLLYFDDQPQEKRLIINGVAQLFQKLIRNYYSCPVHLTSPEKIKIARKLKIGYIGHTLRSHSVGFLSRWLIRHHDREKFAIYTYFVCHQIEDEITQEFFRKDVDQAHNSTNVVNDLITQIEKDQIDILVDLDSFTENMTSIIMALKPAPIQVAWLGMDTNGIPAIDYFIADPYVLPDEAQDYYQEKIWRLPYSYLGVDGFEVDVPNISRGDLDIPSDAIIYLNIQNSVKRHPDIIHSQMKIINAVPHSYLVIKGSGDQEILKQLFVTIAEQEGVDKNRLRFLPQTLTEKIHRANLRIADVMLDTYPYNGATTTLETLWMETPLVTRVGEQFAARNSYTFMINAGITEGIAWSDEEYIEWGIKLGTDENLRKEVSWKLKQSKKTSPLWNGKKFTREMEKAYQQMWEIYVNDH